MFAEIAYYMVLGKPLIFYLGIVTMLSFVVTGTIGFLFHRGIAKIPFKWHPRMAALSFLLAIIHGFLSAAVYF